MSLATLAALWGPLPASGSICVVLKKKVRRFKGQVFLQQRGVQSPVEGATISVLVPGRTEVLAAETTDADGRFTFERIRPGTYRIRARHDDAVSVEAELTVAAGASERETHDVVFEFGNDDDGPCYGGSVSVVDRR